MILKRGKKNILRSLPQVEMDDDTQYLAAGWRLANERAAKDFRKKHPSEGVYL